MIKCKSQISIEYLILTGFIFGVIAISAAIFLRTFASDSAYDIVSAQKINNLGNDLVNKAKQIYYLGLYSKQTIAYDIPANVEKMFIVELTKDNKKYYYFVIKLRNKKNPTPPYVYLSNVPLMSDYSSQYVDNTDNSAIITECNEPGTACIFYNFKGNIIGEGRRRFRLETKQEADEAKVSIVPIIQ